MSVESTLHAWVVATSGVNAQRVGWSDQNWTRPNGPGAWISLALHGETSPGHDWDITTDAAEPEPGADITRTVVGARTATLSIQVHGGDATGDNSSKAILSRVLQGRRLPSVLDAISAGGVGILNCSAIRNVGALVNAATFEPRAQADVRITWMQAVAEDGTYIETVNAENDITDTTVTVTIAPD